MKLICLLWAGCFLTGGCKQNDPQTSAPLSPQASSKTSTPPSDRASEKTSRPSEVSAPPLPTVASERSLPVSPRASSKTSRSSELSQPPLPAVSSKQSLTNEISTAADVRSPRARETYQDVCPDGLTLRMLTVTAYADALFRDKYGPGTEGRIIHWLDRISWMYAETACLAFTLQHYIESANLLVFERDAFKREVAKNTKAWVNTYDLERDSDIHLYIDYLSEEAFDAYCDDTGMTSVKFDAGKAQFMGRQLFLFDIFAYNDQEIEQILAHELGHIFGLPHVHDRADLMYFRKGEESASFSNVSRNLLQTNRDRTFRYFTTDPLGLSESYLQLFMEHASDFSDYHAYRFKFVHVIQQYLAQFQVARGKGTKAAASGDMRSLQPKLHILDPHQLIRSYYEGIAYFLNKDYASALDRALQHNAQFEGDPVSAILSYMLAGLSAYFLDNCNNAIRYLDQMNASRKQHENQGDLQRFIAESTENFSETLIEIRRDCSD